MATPDGGPAFPVAEIRSGEEALALGVPHDGGQRGMTLRDWFAGQALVGLLAAPAAISDNGRNISAMSGYAEMSYRAADLMLAERSK